MLAHALLRTTNGLVVKPVPASPALLCSVLPASESFFFPLRVTQFRLKTGKGQNGGDELVDLSFSLEEWVFSPAESFL